MWDDLHHHLLRSIPPLGESATIPELREIVRPIVADWVGQRIQANLTSRGLRLRFIGQLLTASPLDMRYYFDTTPLAPSISVLFLGAVQTELGSWIERSRRFSFEPSKDLRAART